MDSRGRARSSSSSAGRNLYEGQGRVMSLTTMTADEARAASSARRGAPIGSRRARRISACSSALEGSRGGGASSAGSQPGVMTWTELPSGKSNGSSPSPYGTCSLNPGSSSAAQPKRFAASLSASMTGIGLPLRNCTMAPPAVQT